MKKIRILALVTAVALAVCMFAGCGKQVNDKDEQGRTVISISDWPSTEGKSLDIMNERKARFEEANPDVVVEGDYWTLDRKTFYAKAAGGQLPTLYLAGYTEVPEIINSEYSADLTDCLKERGYDGMFNEDVLEILCDEKERIKSFPNSAYLLGLAYNVEMFEKAGLMEEDGTPKQPKDWNEVVEFALKIKEATGKPGFILQTADHAGGWIFTSIAWSFGTTFMEKDENGKWQSKFNSPECAEALQWVKDLKWKYDLLPANTLITNTELFKVYATGGAGMLITAGDFARRLPQYGMDPNHAGIMAVPAGPKGHYALLGGGSWNVKNNATDDQIDACVRWLEITRSFKLTEEFKTNTIQSIQTNLDNNQLVGIKEMSIWSENSEALKWQNEQIDKMANVNTNHVRLYNEFVADCPAEIRPEEPVCCQELYQILDGCIQEVLTTENANPTEILAKASSDFQTNYLDNLTY